MIKKYIGHGLLMTLLLLNIGCSKVDNLALDQSLNYGDTDFYRAAKFNLQLGLGYLQQGDVERAKGKFLKAIKQAPNMPEAHYNIAHFYYLIDEYELADSHFKKAIDNSKTSNKGVLGTAKNNYGVFLCQTGRYQEAEQQFIGAIGDQDYADTASAYENAGLCYLKASNKTKAHQYFEKALKQNPLSAKALIELTELYLNNNKIKQAKFHLDRYNQLVPSNKRSLLLNLRIAKAQGETHKVEELTARLIKKYPNLEESLETLGNLSMRDSSENDTKNKKSLYNNKLVKYTEIGELATINSFNAIG